jgi:hypothetical protein
MPRLSFASASVCFLLGSTGALLLGCDEGAASGSSSTAGASNGGSSTSVGMSGAGSGGHETTTGGVANLGGVGSTAGTSGTGPNAGAAGTNAAGTGGGSGCAGALFCEDFEAYTGMPAAPWTVRKNAQGAVSIDGAQHKSGTKAVKLTTSGAAAYQQAFISIDKPFPVANNAFYGRMMIYATKAANDGVHWTMIEGRGPGTGGITTALVRYGGQHMQTLMANYDSAGKASDCWQHSQTKMPEGKWACMEWYFEGATNTQKFWLDGKAIDDLTVVGQGQGCVSQGTEGKWIFPTFERLQLGWESYQTDDAREIWIDDVAIGTTQIGCPQ